MPEYLIYFNQQWVGDHDEEWYQGRVAPSRAVIADLQAAGQLVFAGGLVEEVEEAFSADQTSGEVLFTDGPFVETKEYLSGFWVIEAPDLDVALKLAAEGSRHCNRRVEVRPFLGMSM